MTIKVALQHALVLHLPNLSRTFIVTMGESELCMDGGLSQLIDEEKNSVEFLFKIFGLHERGGWHTSKKKLRSRRISLNAPVRPWQIA